MKLEDHFPTRDEYNALVDRVKELERSDRDGTKIFESLRKDVADHEQRIGGLSQLIALDGQLPPASLDQTDPFKCSWELRDKKHTLEYSNAPLNVEGEPPFDKHLAVKHLANSDRNGYWCSCGNRYKGLLQLEDHIRAGRLDSIDSLLAQLCEAREVIEMQAGKAK